MSVFRKILIYDKYLLTHCNMKSGLPFCWYTGVVLAHALHLRSGTCARTVQQICDFCFTISGKGNSPNGSQQCFLLVNHSTVELLIPTET